MRRHQVHMASQIQTQILQTCAQTLRSDEQAVRVSARVSSLQQLNLHLDGGAARDLVKAILSIPLVRCHYHRTLHSSARCISLCQHTRHETGYEPCWKDRAMACLSVTVAPSLVSTEASMQSRAHGNGTQQTADR